MSNQALHAKLVLQFYLWLQRKRNKDNLRKPRILFGDSVKLNYRNLLGKEASWVLQKRMPGSVWNQEVYGRLLTQQLLLKPNARLAGRRILAQDAGIGFPAPSAL